MQINFMHIDDLEELCFKHRLFSLLFAYVLCSPKNNMTDSLDEDSCFYPMPKTGKSGCTWKVSRILGSSDGVVNSLDFCPASLKPLGCIYFQCVLSSQWKTVTVNLQILHCQL